MNTVGITKNSLHIGDTVLFCTQLRDGCGYIYKELSSSYYNVMTVYPAQDQDPDFPNIAFATFNVLARNKFQKKQELKKLEFQKQQEIQRLEERWNNLKLQKILGHQESSELLKEYEDHILPNARAAVEAERLENDQEQQKKYGTKVVYGDFLQLQHMSSSMLVTANSEASKTEGNHLLVNLLEENSEGGVFRILPSYKVKSVGDEVHYDDQIKLESIKTPGQFLHVSAFHRSFGSAGIPINQNHYELNLSANESSFQLICHSPYSNSPSSMDLWLKAGDCIRLFHKQDECYLVAEGSFAGDNRITENVHCRQRRVDQRKTTHFPSSANTFWQIEKERLRNSTSVISWRERCRIKHLPTRLYLAVCKVPGQEDKWKVTLQEEDGHKDVNTLFSFHPLIQEGSDVLLDSYALLQHCSSRQWLHLNKSDEGKYFRKTSHADDVGLKGLQWDSAELYQITTSKEKLDYDAFTIQKVSADLTRSFNFVAGIVPILSNHLKELEKFHETVPIKNASNVTDAVRELGDWLKADSDRETKNRQKLLRNLRVLAQLIEMLKASKEHTSSIHHCRTLCRECYNVLKKYLNGDSRKNENYLAQFIEFFQSQVHQGLNAEDLLVEIVQDNLSIVSRMQTQISEMIKEFRRTKDSRFLDFLSSLCVCSGRPIPSTQDRVLKELKLKLEDKLFIRTKVVNEGGEDIVAVCYHNNGKSNYIEISQFEKLCSSDNKKCTGIGVLTDADFDIFMAQLHLFARLCEGNNKTSIITLSFPRNNHGFVSFREAIICVKNPNLSPKLRSRYVELILVMFIDVDENVPFLDNLTYSFVFGSIVENPYDATAGSDGETISLTKVENIHFPELKEWLQTTLENSKVRCDENSSEENLLLERIINILAYLVRYGYYDDMKDVEECTKFLIRFLNEKTECSYSNASFSEEDLESKKVWRIDCKSNRPVFAIKAKVLEVLSLFYKFKFYVKLQKFIYDFKMMHTTSARKRVGTLPGGSSPFAMLRTLFITSEDEDFLFSKDKMNAVRSHLKILCKDSQLSALQNEDESLKQFIKLLIDISCYESEELNKLSLNLLLQMHFFEDDLLEKAKQTQLLIYDESMQIHEEVSRLLPKLRHLMRVDPDQRTQKEMMSILERLISLCVLPHSDEEPNSENQTMLDNFGIVSDILSFILDKGLAGIGMTAVPGSPDVICTEVYQRCFRLLKNLAADNKKIQASLFDSINKLLQIKTSPNEIEIMADLADLLTEIFTGGPELVLRIEESHIETIFETIVHCGNSRVQAQFMMTLQALAKIEDLNLPVERNQEVIIRNFCRLRREFCEEVLGEEVEHKRKRCQILHIPAKCDSDPRLILLLSATDMLAACAEGKNLYIESVCQNIFSLEEIIDVIGSQLPPMRKKPFVRFLIWVYMKTADDKNDNRRSVLKHGNTMWCYLEKLTIFLDKIASVYRLVPLEEQPLIKQEFKGVMRARTRSSLFSLRRPKLRSNSSRIPNIIGEDGSIKPGMLEFIVEGILPLLHTYYSLYFSPKDAPSESLKSQEIETSAQIFNKLLLLQSVLAKNYLSVSDQVELFQGTIQSFLKFPAVVERAGVSDEGIATIRNIGKNLVESLQPQPQYARQQELNKDFHRYCMNYITAYKGPNNARQQIGPHAIDRVYNDPGEELPLGPHFQNLIALYNETDDEDRVSDGGVRYEAEYILYQLEVSRCRTLRLNEAEQEIQDILDTRCLQLLRGLIHNKIKLLDPEEKERNPSKFREKSIKLFVPVQNEIQKFGENGIQNVMPLLSHIKPHIAQEALALFKAMLYSGNVKVQMGIVINAKETREETLFLNLKRILEIAGQNYKDMRALQNLLEKRNVSMAEKRGQNIFKLPDANPSPKRKPLIKNNNHSHRTSRQEVNISLEELERISVEVEEQEYTSSIKDDDQDSLEFIMQCDKNWITLVLEVIGLMCDGQHRALQDYLRDQPDNFKTANVVAEVATFLQTFTRELIGSDWRQINQILQALIEMCVGNPKNQLVIFDAVRVVEPLNRLLELPNDVVQHECTKNLEKCLVCQNLLWVLKVKGSTVELLEIMLEETTYEAAVIAEGIGYTINVKAVQTTMEMFNKLQSNALVKAEELDDDCERGMFRAHNILVSLHRHKAIAPGLLKTNKDSLFDKCTSRALQIEIHYECEGKDPVLAQVQFPYNPEDKLRQEIKETVRWNINRDSMDDKHRALLELMPSLQADIKRQQYLKKKLYWRPVVSFHLSRHYLLLFLTFLLNLFLLFVYRVPSNSRNSNSPFIPSIPSWFPYLLYPLGCLHTILSLWMGLEYFVINYPHFRLPHFLLKLILKLKRIWMRKTTHNKYILNTSTCLDVNVFGVMTIYVIVFVICSILSLAYVGFFYPVCLLYIIVNNDILQRVLRAVTKNGISLILVAILGVVVLFIYAVGSFAFLHQYFVSTSNAELYCETLVECMYTILRYGLLDNIGLLVPFNNTEGIIQEFNYSLHFGRLIFDISFFIIVITIGLNVVFGIIVDTFSQLREERSNVEDDEKSTCFICNLPSHEFDRKGKGFKHHIDKEHNMWDYVYYAMYLDGIDTGDHNAIQKYVHEIIFDKECNSPTFFPQEEAKCLTTTDSPSDTIMVELMTKVDQMLHQFNQKDQQKRENAKQREQEKWDSERCQRSL